MTLEETEHLYHAVNLACTCGGGGPDDGCPACQVWHHMLRLCPGAWEHWCGKPLPLFEEAP